MSCFLSPVFHCLFRMKKGRVAFRPGILMVSIVLVPLLAGVLPAPAAEVPSPGDVPPGMALRWVPPFYITVPSDWKPMMDGEDMGFYTGAHPDAMDDPSMADLPLVAISVTRQKARKGGGYRAFFEEMERSLGKDKTKNFTSKEEEITIGSRPAVYYSLSADVEMRGKTQKAEMNLVVAKEPDAEGKHILVMIAGKSASIEKYRDVIKTMLSSAREGVPPLEKSLSFLFGATDTSFRHSEGPFVAADGTVALLDRFGKRIRLFDASGTLLDEWGEKGKGEDGTFAWPTVIAFAPDGSLYVADEGYSVDANIQRFSRKGEFLGKIKADKKTLGEKGLYKPWFLAVTETGKIVAAGSKEGKDGKPRLLVFSPEGELLLSRDMKIEGPMALLPGEKLVIAEHQADNDRADIFSVYDLEGNLLKEWPLWGSDLPALPGEKEIYFQVEYLGADAEGRVYAYDDSEEGIWIYGPDGRFLQVLPVRRTFGIMEGMAVLPDGDVLVKDRPSGYAPGVPSVHRMKNAWPARVPEQPRQETPSVQPPSDVPPQGEETPPEVSQTDPDEKSLENELARLKEALRLREEAAALEKEGNRAGAAAKYRESLAFHDDPEVKDYAEGLERMVAASVSALPKETAPFEDVTGRDARRQAETLWKEAGDLQQAKKYEEALALYRKGLELSPDRTVSDHVAKLEAFMPKAKASAEEIWKQAGQLQNAKKYGEALKKYKEGLDIYHNKVVEEHVGKLEAFIARQKK
ncbi:hypothetical protein [Aminivibrio sp.]|uniref:hypothetical protein n=1 Tax=Aminivibrio sp. TaxID=1872489 RepID=UPI001A6068A9|nr:hypothetical protein [Aminivibrio sp.]MBL3539335.1 hypothetical protein [Aminivibrio sp.]